jgi:hypothetical protein
MMNISPYISILLLILAAMLLPPATSNAVDAPATSVCEQCHGGQTGRGGAPVPLWKQSIHAANGITCHSCHGGDPQDAANAMNPLRGFLGVPKEGDIPGFCGRCHIGILNEYLRSAHGKALNHGGPTCVTCHSAHAVKKAGIDLINEKSCGSCHPYAKGTAIKEAMAQTDGELVKVEKLLVILQGEGFDTTAREKSLFALKNRYHQLFHEISLQRIAEESKSIKDELGKIQNWLDSIVTEKHQRKVAGAGVIGGFLLIALICYLLRKTYS